MTKLKNPADSGESLAAGFQKNLNSKDNIKTLSVKPGTKESVLLSTSEASNVVPLNADLVGEITGKPSLIAPGEYQLAYYKHWCGYLFGPAPKLIIVFRVVTFGAAYGVKLLRCYNVKSFNRKRGTRRENYWSQPSNRPRKTRGFTTTWAWLLRIKGGRMKRRFTIDERWSSHPNGRYRSRI